MSDASDFTTGESVKVGARVDEGIYAAFREWVEEQTGKQYNEVGDALERAMLEYMDKDRYHRIEQDVSDIKDTTMRNEALIRKVLNNLDHEKEKSKSTSVPQGKDPGSRKVREAHVIRGLLLNEMQTVRLETLREAVEEFAQVSSDRTVESYVEAITNTAAFQPSQIGNAWSFDAAGAREVLRKRDVDVPEMEA